MIRRLIDLWWGSAPARASRAWAALGMVLRDGEYLEGAPVVAAAAPACALIVGALAGWLHPLAHDPYTTAPLLMALALAVGTLGAGLGAWMVVGYAVGEIFVARPAAYGGAPLAIIETVGAVLLCDIVLAMLVVIIPLTARALSAEVAARWMPGRGEVPTFAVAMLAVAGMSFAWSQAALVLTRPYFVWHGIAPPGAVSAALRLSTWVLPLVSAVAMAARGVLETRLARGAARRPAAELRRRGVRLPAPVATAWRVVFAVFLLAGLMDTWIDAALVGVAMAVLLVLREPALHRIETRLVVVLRLPILPRLLAGSVISALVAVGIVSIVGADGFIRPIVVSTLISLIVFSILLPDSVLGEQRHEGGGALPPPPPPPPPAIAAAPAAP